MPNGAARASSGSARGFLAEELGFGSAAIRVGIPNPSWGATT
jgi:hypothetical protein